MVLILAPPLNRLTLWLLGFICELYAGLLQSERELAVLYRVHCCEINVWAGFLKGVITLFQG